jgi:hypothetical protein
LWNEFFFSAPQLKRDPLGAMLFAFSRLMSESFRLLVRVAGAGCLLIGAAHISTFLNLSLPPVVGPLLGMLLFAIWFAAMIAVGRFNRRVIQAPRRLWSIVLECAPTWMRAFVIVTWVYAVVNWIAATGTLSTISSGDEHFARVASGVGLAFCATAMAILYSAGADVLAPRCPEGHLIRDAHQICPVCGTSPKVVHGA